MDLGLVFIWVAASLAFASLSALAAARWGSSILIAHLAALAPISTILVTKIVELGPIVIPASIITYPMAYFVTDLLCEIWGKREARKAVWMGLYVSVVTVILIYFVTLWSAPAFALQNAEMFNTLFAMLPRAVFAGFIAYVIAQHLDVTLFHWLKELTNGKHLWLRNNGSTIITHVVDSSIFITLAFYGMFPILPMIVGQVIVKAIIAFLDTPFIYGVVALTKKIQK